MHNISSSRISCKKFVNKSRNSARRDAGRAGLGDGRNRSGWQDFSGVTVVVYGRNDPEIKSTGKNNVQIT
jgi:hypothetical protein